MSHVTTAAVKIKSLDALKQAVNEFGAALVTASTFKSYQRGLACDLAIKLPGCEYEIGVQKQKDGTYTLAYDFYGPGEKLKAKFGDKLAKLQTGYNKHVILAQAKKAGKMVTQIHLTNGEMKIRIS